MYRYRVGQGSAVWVQAPCATKKKRKKCVDLRIVFGYNITE